MYEQEMVFAQELVPGKQKKTAPRDKRSRIRAVRGFGPRVRKLTQQLHVQLIQRQLFERRLPR
jgi:hypothetical protein